MNVLLDARLERVDTWLGIIDRDTGKELLISNSAMGNDPICTADFKKHPLTDEELLNLVACLGN